MIGRHADEATVASEARRRRLAGFMLIPALGLGAAAAIVPLAIGSAPSVQASELRQPPKVTQPAPVAGPVQPIFDFADVQPWDPGKAPVVVKPQPVVTSRSAKRVPAAQKAAGATTTPRPVPTVPPNRPGATQPVSTPPPRDDPLTDDGTFGDGCEQPGTPERCDPAPVGLPPVVVVETPPVVVEEPEETTTVESPSHPEVPAQPEPVDPLPLSEEAL